MADIQIAPLPVAPGATLSEQLEIWSMTQKELALRMGISPKHVNEIIKGKSPVTMETALKLESVLGLPASFWTGLEADYREAKARQSNLRIDKKEEEIIKAISYNELAKLGWVEEKNSIREKINSLRSFFGIANLTYIPKLIPIAFRKSDIYNPSELSLAIWLRKGELEAQDIQTGSYKKSKLKRIFPEIKKLTQKPFKEALESLTQLLADCGIALVIVPHIAKTHVNGAVKWINSEKVLLQLSFKGSYADIFWFSLFHELGHIYLEHNRKETIIDHTDHYTEIEQEADDFAKNSLIPENEYIEFVSSGVFSQESVTTFAKKIKIHRGIVVGRLMHDKLIAFNQCIHLRKKCEMS